MNQLDQTIEDLKFCVETLGMNDEQVEEFMDITGPVSYTHLTLPTSDLV